MALTRVALVALAVTGVASAAGNLQLLVAPQDAAESIAGATVQLTAASVGDRESTRFRLRNTGDAAAVLATLRVDGIGFTMTGHPSLPHIVAPGMNVDFTVHFSPTDYGTFSANLLVNSTGYLLVSGATPAITVFHNGQALVSGDTIDFGAAERGSQRTVAFVFKNTLNQPAAITRATVTGAPFRFGAGPPAASLAPGQSAVVEVIFSPIEAGVFRSTMAVDNREFRLTGTAMEPSIPRPTVVIDSPAIRSGEQGRVSVRFAEKSRGRARGKLTMELRPAGSVRDNDGAARFVTGSSRSVEFQVVEGQMSAGAEDGFTFQAGTTAGTIVFTAEAGGFTEQAVVVVAPEAVRIDKSAAARTSAGVDVQFSGFDNTRTISDVSFTFYTKSGQPLPGMPVKLPAGSAFERWWQESKLGGVFLFRASFPITGNASEITGVAAAVVNASGRTEIQRMSF